MTWLKGPTRNFLASLFVGLGAIAIGMTGDIQHTESSVEISRKPVQKTPPVALVNTPWLEKAGSAANLEELAKLTTGFQERRLLRALMEDELEEGSPFAKLSSQYPLAVLLSKGVRSFQRATYRTNGFRGEAGYDLLTYEVVHNDGTHSEIMAYMEQGSREDVVPDKLGTAATMVLFSLSESSQTNSYNLYKNNELMDHGSIPNTEAQAMVSRRVSASVPFMAISSRE